MTQETFSDICDAARVPKSNAGWRCVIGELGEQIAAERLSAQRLHTGSHVTESNWYCPDLRNRVSDFEVKTCGLSNHIIIYYVRLLKDRAYSELRPLCYVVVKHFCSIPQPSALEARAIMLETARVFVIPFRYIDGICSTVTPRILNKKYKPSNGWCQRGYEKGGYYIPWKLIAPFAIEV